MCMVLSRLILQRVLQAHFALAVSVLTLNCIAFRTQLEDAELIADEHLATKSASNSIPAIRANAHADFLFGQSGPLSNPTMQHLRGGIQAAFHEVNLQHKMSLGLISLNDDSEPDICADNTRRMVSHEHVFALLGYYGTRTTKAALPIAKEHSVPILAPSTGASFLRNPSRRDVVNIIASYIDEIEALMSLFLDTLNLTRVSLFYQRDLFGEEGVHGLNIALERRRKKIHSLGAYQTNTLDVQSGIQQMRTEAPPEVVVIFASRAIASSFLHNVNTIWPNAYFSITHFAGLSQEDVPKNMAVFSTQVVPDPSDTQHLIVREYQAALKTINASSAFDYASMHGYIAGRFVAWILSKAALRWQSVRNVTRKRFLTEIFEHQRFVNLSGLEIGPYGPHCNQGLHEVFGSVIRSDSHVSFPLLHIRFETCTTKRIGSPLRGTEIVNDSVRELEHMLLPRNAGGFGSLNAEKLLKAAESGVSSREISEVLLQSFLEGSSWVLEWVIGKSVQNVSAAVSEIRKMRNRSLATQQRLRNIAHVLCQLVGNSSVSDYLRAKASDALTLPEVVKLQGSCKSIISSLTMGDSPVYLRKHFVRAYGLLDGNTLLFAAFLKNTSESEQVRISAANACRSQPRRIPQCEKVLRDILQSEEALSDELLDSFCSALLVNTELFMNKRCIGSQYSVVAESKRETYMAKLCHELATDIGRPFQCSDQAIVVPQGYMLTHPLHAGQRHSAWLCPNPAACTNVAWTLIHNRTIAKHLPACHKDYIEDNRIPGCVQCQLGLGRAVSDVFECIPCKHFDFRETTWLKVGFLQMGTYIGSSFGLYGYSLYSAKKTKTKTRLSSLVKITLSFCAATAGVLEIVKNSNTFKELGLPSVQEAIVFFDSVGSTASSEGFSLDCILRTLSLETSSKNWLLLTCFAPAFLLLVHVVCGVIHHRQSMQNFFGSLVIPTVVLGIVFLPPLLARCINPFPCIHMQNGEAAELMVAFRLTSGQRVACDTHHVLSGIALASFAILICTATGPVYWHTLISKAQTDSAFSGGYTEQVNSAEHIGFLVAGYRSKAQYWEIVVQVRRMLLFSSKAAMPLTYACREYLIVLQVIQTFSLVVHIRVRPYEDRYLNAVEAITLGISAVAPTLTDLATADSWVVTPPGRHFAMLCLSAMISVAYIGLGLSLVRASLVRPGQPTT